MSTAMNCKRNCIWNQLGVVIATVLRYTKKMQERHDRAVILLKLALNTNQSINQSFKTK